MLTLLCGVGLIVGGGLASVLPGLGVRRAARLAAVLAVVGSLLGLGGATNALVRAAQEQITLAWPLPYTTVSFLLDPLSAWFLVALFLLVPVAAVYGFGSSSHERSQRNLGGQWLFFSLLVAGMAFVFLANAVVLFLVAWEIMSLAAYFLVTHEDSREDVREAGWTYLVATHLGTICLIASFVLLGQGSRSLIFSDLAASNLSPTLAGVVFLLALAGFGAKAGFVPLHVWLPEAHPAAPSHVSALMSGVMIKTGVYGLIRVLLLLGMPPMWWGWVVLSIGLVSGVLGVLLALAQHDLKRLLAYHSVENVGIIATGLGLGLMGVASSQPVLAALCFGGALFHVLNHAIFKGLLFLCAGAIAHTAHTLEIDHLGGLARRMPVTAGTFLVGAAAISGLPPLNGFMSELLIYVGAFHSVASGGQRPTGAIAAIVGLALIGGLAVACFTKAFGIVFLGVPRSSHAQHAHEVGGSEQAAMLSLAVACVLVAAVSPWVVSALHGPLATMHTAFGLSPEAGLGLAHQSLSLTVVSGAAFAGFVATLGLARYLWLRHQIVNRAPTWGCGYAAPTSRMQYTASSFAQPLVSLFVTVLGTRVTVQEPSGYFPSGGSLVTSTPDPVKERIFKPVFQGAGRAIATLRVLQQGRVQTYVLYIAAALIFLLLVQVP